MTSAPSQRIPVSQHGRRPGEPGDGRAHSAYGLIMTRDGHRTLPRPPSLLARVLQSGSFLLGLLAGACWVWAGMHPLELDLFTDSVRELPRWWSSAGAVAGIAVAGMTWFAWRSRGRAGLVVLGSVLLVTAAGGVAFWVYLVPRANPIHPIGSGVPYGAAGFALAGVAGVLTGLAVALSGGWRTAQPPPRPIADSRSRVVSTLLVAALAVPAVAAAAVFTVDRSRTYLLDVNEYRTTGDLDRSPGPPPASSLVGGDSWRAAVPGLAITEPAATEFGLAVSSGQSVIMLDRTTGAVRWRYTRSDVTGDASVASSDAGRQVLVWWAGDIVYVLDARTGERVGHWDDIKASSILNAGLPLIAQAGSDGRIDVVRVSTRAGDVLWRYSLGECQSVRAVPAGKIIVLRIAACTGVPDRIVGLDPASGRLLWSRENATDAVSAVAEGVVLMLSPPQPAESIRHLSAIGISDGETRWRRELPQVTDAGGTCQNVVVRAEGQLVEVGCDFELTADLADVRTSAGLYVYDSGTGSMVRHIMYPDGAMGSAVVTADGRALVTHGDWEDGCVLDTVLPSSRTGTTSIQPGRLHECAYISVVALEEQVFVLDSQRGMIRSLR